MDRIRQELKLVEKQYGTVSVAEDLSWLIVEEFPLPDGMYNCKQTRLLHFINKAYPQSAPDNFLVPAGLRTTVDELPGTGYKENQQHFGEKWGIFSWHPQQWRPHANIQAGDNLVTFLLTAEKRLLGDVV